MSAVPLIKKKPRRPWRWLLGGVLILFGACVVGVAAPWLRRQWEAWQEQRQLDAVIAETGKKDPDWRWERIQEDLEPIPDDQNSAVVVQRVIDSFGRWNPDLLKLPDGRFLSQVRPAPNLRLDEVSLALLRHELGEYEDSVALALSLKDYPRGRFAIELSDNFIGTKLSHLQAVRAPSSALDLDVERLMHAGRAAEAPDRVRATLCAAACLRDDPFVTSALVRIALRALAVRRIERILGMGELSDAGCAALVASLEAEHHEELMLRALRGERAGHHRLFENFRSGKVSLAAFLEASGAKVGGEPDSDDRHGAVNPSYRLAEDETFMLSRMNALCDAIRLPVEQQQAVCHALDSEVRAAPSQSRGAPRLLISRLMLPANIKVFEASLRDKANLASAIAALAAERFRLANGRWPTSLKEVQPRFIAGLPADPYTGGTLRLLRRPEGIVIYSVGRDGVDDGGKVEVPAEVGYPPDFGMRLYDADKRGLPPPPPPPPKDD